MSYKCDSHKQTATAYCKVHNIVLCTKCFIENTHKETDCNVCEIKDISDGIAVYLDIKNVREIARMKEENINEEREALEELQRSLKVRVESRFSNLVEKLDDKKNKTIDLLERNIDRKRSFNTVQSETLASCITELSTYSKQIEELGSKYSVIDVGEVRLGIAKIKTKVEEISVNILGKENGNFIPNEDGKLFYAKEEFLGYFEFDDDIYVEPVDENLEPNENDLMSSDVYESLPNVSSIFVRSENDLARNFSQIHVLRDNRTLLLDSANGHLLIVDNEGTVVNTFIENGDGRVHVVACSWSFVKNEYKIALLGFDDTGPFIRQVKFLAKDTFQNKSKVRVLGPLQKYELDVKSFCFDEPSSTCAIVLKDRIIHVQLQKEKVVDFHSLNAVTVGNTSEADMVYDFQEKSLYILNKQTNSLKRYNCKTSELQWEEKFANDTKRFKPLGITLKNTDNRLLVICTEKIILLDLSDGKTVNAKEDYKFPPDLLAFCLKGNDVLTSRRSATSTLYLHLQAKCEKRRYTRNDYYHEVKIAGN